MTESHGGESAETTGAEEVEAAGGSFGSVFVFNLYAAPVSSLNLNNQGSVGTIGVPMPSGWNPPQLAVQRTNLTVDQLDSPLFVNGENQLAVNYGGEAWLGSPYIPPPPTWPMWGDLWIYLAYQQGYVFTSDGTPVSAFDMRRT